MGNFAGYPSAVITGAPGKSGRIQGLGAVAPPPFSPLDIPNIVFWLDANDISTIDDVSGVEEWRDKGPLGNNVNQSSVLFRPFYDTTSDTTNFVSFDGNNDFMENTGYFGGAVGTPQTFVFVARVRINTGSDALFDSFLPPRIILNKATAQLGMFDGSFVLVGPNPVGLVNNILVAIYNGASSRFYFNGGVADTPNLSGANSMDGIFLSQSQVGTKGDWDIFEGTMYSTIPSDSEINQLGNFFAAKHSLTWTDI